MINVSQYLRAEYKHIQLLEALKLPPSALLGVSNEGSAALAAIGILTLFDLGSAWLFVNARAATQAGEFGTSSQRLGMASTDWFKDSATVQATALEELGDIDIIHLRGMSDEQADALKLTLGISKVRELAFWPPQKIARQMVGDSIGNTLDTDELQTELLRPRFGEYPTERAYYTTLVMLDLGQSEANRADVNAPLPLNSPQQEGFTRIAVGAILTLSQSWYALGVTLGQMLHSLALAPGEATRIAVIDWTRRTRASTTESITESEALDSASEHTRAISEVQSATARDFQKGGSASSSSSSSESGSVAGSVGTGFVPSLWADAEFSGNYQTANTQASAQSSSWSRGTRSITGRMTQNVNDRTEQHSTSVRNRRATAVREVSQSEHESISTRIIANYNHMHALTVQYYEVVQLYRTVSELHNTERCLFIPMQLLTFIGDAGQQIIDQYRGVLIGAALNRRIRALLVDDTTSVAIKPEKAVIVPFRSIHPELYSPLRNNAFTGVRLAATESPQVVTPAPTSPPQDSHLAPTIRSTWDLSEIARVVRIIDRPIVRPDSNALFFPDDAEVISISFEGVNITQVRLDHVGTTVEDSIISITNGLNRADLTTPIALNMLEAIHVIKSTEAAVTNARMFITLSHLGRRFSTPAIPIDLGYGTASQRVVALENDRADRRQEIQEHLQANRAYYSTAVFRSLDSASIVQLLTPYQWNGQPLIDQIEPKPLTVVGNFLVLRAPVEDHESSGVKDQGEDLTWAQLMELRGLNSVKPDTRLVPIPTNGVFAEAVLGRSNSAEKLDLTRFWNWQDSPIPFSPPDIAPISAGSRGETENIVPSQLGQPVLNILNPSNLPDPAGLNAILAALANGNMFRDMSGLVGTQDLARVAMQDTLQAATDSGQLTSDNLRTHAQKSVAMAQVAADIIKSMYGAGGGSNPVQSISGAGARINHGRDMDQRQVSNSHVASQTPVSPDGQAGSTTSPNESNLRAGGQDEYSHEAAYANQNAFGYSPEVLGNSLGQLRQISYQDSVEMEHVPRNLTTAPCLWSFADPGFSNIEARRLTLEQARDMLVFHHAQGEIELLPEPTFDSSCKILTPDARIRVRMKGTVAGVQLYYSASGIKSQPVSATPELGNLDVRNAVGLYRLCRWLRDNWGVNELHHVGIGVGRGPANDCHNEGRAIDFVGVKGVRNGVPLHLYIWDDWAAKSVPNRANPNGPRLPDWPQGSGTLSYRLASLPARDQVSHDFFLALYGFVAMQYQDQTETPTQPGSGSQIGESSFIMHPDHPASSPGTSHGREAHRAHMHFQIGRT